MLGYNTDYPCISEGRLRFPSLAPMPITMLLSQRFLAEQQAAPSLLRFNFFAFLVILYQVHALCFGHEFHIFLFPQIDINVHNVDVGYPV